MKRRGWLILAVGLLPGLWLAPPAAGQEHEFRDGRWVRAAEPPASAGPAEQDVARIRDLIARGKWRTAHEAAKKFLRKYPDEARREEVLLLAGQAQVGRGLLFQGYEWFEKQLSEFPAGELSDQALREEYDVAEAFLAGKKRVSAGIFRLPAKDDGLEILTRIAEHAPGSALAEQALMRIAEFHYARGEWKQAVDAYDHYGELFGKGPRGPHASLQAARAMFAAFRGVEYDDTPLLDAEQRFRLFAEQYPSAAAAAGVTDILRQIAELRAEKAYQTGRFYERTHRPSAAAFCYRQVLETYPGAGSAARAREALGRLGDMPAETPSPRGPAATRPQASRNEP